MDKNTILQLNQLNKQFYQKIAEEFSATRAESWLGWQQLLPYLNQLNSTHQPLNVLDVGCGNGRFATFLHERFHQPFKYSGIDNNQQLLDLAQAKLKQLELDFSLFHLDLVDELINDRPLKIDQLPSLQLVTLFGVMHHIPDQQLRIKLLNQLSSIVESDSLIIFTVWQFIHDDRFKNKIIDPQLVGLNPNQLEPHDYILDWQRGQIAHRYCHQLDQAEINQLLEECALEQVATFLSDGKSNQLNRYVIAQPRLRRRV